MREQSCAEKTHMLGTDRAGAQGQLPCFLIPTMNACEEQDHCKPGIAPLSTHPMCLKKPNTRYPLLKKSMKHTPSK